MDRTIKVWYAGDEPEEYRALGMADDRDFVAFVPNGLEQPCWMGSGSPFGACIVQRFGVEGGIVYIGHHS